MKFVKKDVIVGFILIIIVVLGVFLFKKGIGDKAPIISEPNTFQFKKNFEDKFKIKIPNNSNSIEIKDVSGGNSSGIATEKEVLVDADDPNTGYYYEGWIEKEDGTLTSIGKLQMAKGGWLLEYDKNIYSQVSKIIISLEKLNDKKLEKRILEGSF